MRGQARLRYTVMILGLVALFALTASAGCKCLDVDTAVRANGEFGGTPTSSGSLKLEAAIGSLEWSLNGWASLNVLPVPIVSFGANIKLVRDWLSLNLMTEPGVSSMNLALTAQASPPSWLLYEGVPTFIGGLSATSETTLLGGTQASKITLSPFVTAVIPAGETTVSPSIGLDVSLNTEAMQPAISGARLVSTIHAGGVLIAATGHFTGVFEKLSSLVMSVNVPDWGVTVSGMLIPFGNGDFSYRVAISYEWGDTYLLPDQTGKPETVCTGGVCF